MSQDLSPVLAKVIEAVRGAHNNFRSLYAAVDKGSIPVSLEVAGSALDKLMQNLDLLAGSTSALTSDYVRELFDTPMAADVKFSDAITHDMDAVASCLRLMMPSRSSEPVMAIEEHQCRDVTEMVERYDRTISSALIHHDVSSLDVLVDIIHSMLGGMDDIRDRFREQQESSIDELRDKVHRRLLPVSSARYNSKDARPGCLDGTRDSVHQELFAWVNDDAPALTTMWLSGMAGIGKSAIAYTFAQRMEEEGLLGATFFVDRQFADRRDPHRIVQSLAYDLAVHDHNRLQALWSSLCSDPTIMNKPLQDQVKKLIKKPLDGRCPQALVILIDGLDECTPSDGARLLSTLVSYLLNFPVKLFISSRGDQDIVQVFQKIYYTRMLLQDRHVDEVSRDVRRYWEDSLDKLRFESHPVEWRALVSLDLLVELTGPLFIYATTVLRIIQNTRHSPIEKLNKLLETSRSGTAAFAWTSELSALEQIYFYILTEAVKDKRGNMKAEYVLRMHDILEIIIFAHKPLTPQALSDLLGMDRDELDAYLTLLRSVLVIPDDNSPEGVVRPLHQSFPNFVRHQGGLVHPQLTMHMIVANKHITERCLVQLNRHLRFNICNIKDASLFNREVTNLPTRLNEYVSAALRYSCLYWLPHFLEHLRVAGDRAQVPLGLEQFCEQHILHWIEVLSLTEDMNAVQQVMPELISVINSHQDWKDLEFCSLLTDAYFLMRGYQFPISLSALHVYHSAVVSMPECALRRQANTYGTARLILERDPRWMAENMILEGHTDWVRSVGFSYDGSRTVSGSGDHTVRIWDAVTGIALHTLKDHTDEVTSVAFSSDGLRIVSGSHDCTVRIWDAIPGAVLHTLKGHTSTVNSVAFSPDGLHIASGSCDCTVRTWDTISGAVRHILEGHTDRVFSVAFSPDSLSIVSGSCDCTVRIWDAVTGMALHTLEGHTSTVTSTAFSPDGLRILSGSHDRTVRMWDAISGTVLHTLEGHTSTVNSVAFSYDSLHLISGSRDCTVRIWDAVSSVVQRTLEGHTDWVFSVAFSPDGLRIVSGSRDCTVRIWDAVSAVVQHTFEGHTDMVTSVAFPPLRNDEGENSGTFKLDEACEGWLLRRGADGRWRRLCWLPHKRRDDAEIISCHGQKVVIAARGGLLTILDCSDI